MMQVRTLRAARLPFLVLCLSALGACKHSGTEPEEIIIPPDLVQRSVTTGLVNLCVVGPSGDYTFTVSREGGVTGGTLLVDPTFIVASGTCRNVWAATPTDRVQDPITTVTIAGTARPTGSAFDHISAAATNNARDYTVGTNTVDFRMNVYHGGAVTFFYKTAP